MKNIHNNIHNIVQCWYDFAGDTQALNKTEQNRPQRLTVKMFSRLSLPVEPVICVSWVGIGIVAAEVITCVRVLKDTRDLRSVKLSTHRGGWSLKHTILDVCLLLGGCANALHFCLLHIFLFIIYILFSYIAICEGQPLKNCDRLTCVLRARDSYFKPSRTQ